MEEKLSFGKFIIKKRKEACLTQKELAEKLYITESAVSKWERGISYPDISLVAAISEVLHISEHELLTASEDYQQKEIEKQAKSFRYIVKTYSWAFYLMYGIAIVTCFIVNLAVSHKLSWFFIVLTGIMAAFSLTSLPVLVKKFKGVVTLGAFFLSLNLLLIVCCLYTGGDWFFTAFVSLLFGFAVVFLPFVLRSITLPFGLSQHKSFLCLLLDTILLVVLLAVSCAYAGKGDTFFGTALPITLFAGLLPWLYLLTIRYIKINGLFKTSICMFVIGVYMLIADSVIEVILEGGAFNLPKYNFSNWSTPYLDGNITLLSTIIIIVLAVLFCAGGIMLEVKKKN